MPAVPPTSFSVAESTACLDHLGEQRQPYADHPPVLRQPRHRLIENACCSRVGSAGNLPKARPNAASTVRA